jgi:hypothetical protein
VLKAGHPESVEDNPSSGLLVSETTDSCVTYIDISLLIIKSKTFVRIKRYKGG